MYKCISVTAKELVSAYYFFKDAAFIKTDTITDYSLLLCRKQSDIFYYYFSFIEKDPINWIKSHSINYSSSCYNVYKYNVQKENANYNLFIASNNIKSFYQFEEKPFSLLKAIRHYFSIIISFWK